ncbi:MAG: hypothetical protein KGL39_00510 [Patescibacteria group bacterium]|nr:hypothetical protein [Patescibacteria group bacterium]
MDKEKMDHEIIKELENLSRLQRDWDSYDGLPLSSISKQKALAAIAILKDQQILPVPAVVLGSAGTVNFEWQYGGKELEIGFSLMGIMEYTKVDNKGRVIGGEIGTWCELESLISWLINGAE